MEIIWNKKKRMKKIFKKKTNNVQMRAHKSWWPTGNVHLDEMLMTTLNSKLDGLWSIWN